MRFWPAAVLLVVGLALVGGSVAGVLRAESAKRDDASVSLDLEGHRVELEPGAVLTQSQRQRMRATTATDDRFVVPSVGLDVPLGALSEVDGQITPPGFTAAYRVRNRGVDVAHASDGTVYVVMHSLQGAGVAPGDYLSNVSTGTSKLKPGAEILVDGRRFVVTGSELVAKPALAAAKDVWSDEAGRLVVITCLERPTGPSVNNLVIFAKYAEQSRRSSR